MGKLRDLTLIERMRALLEKSEVDKTLWALCTTIYLLNGSPKITKHAQQNFEE